MGGNCSSEEAQWVAYAKLRAGREIAREAFIKAVSRNGESSPLGGDSDLSQAVGRLVGPAHLLRLRHSMADDQVHRRPGDAAADRQADSVTRTVVDQRAGVILDAAGPAVKIPCKPPHRQQ